MAIADPPAERGSADGREEVLEGGGTTVVTRVGQTVRRPLRPWSAAVHRLLEHLRAAGFAGAPRILGTDGGREILDYIEGEVGNYPLPEQARGERALASAARLLRSYHDATVALADQRPDGWQLPAIEPVEVVCHGDFAPYNCVFAGGQAIAMIDFDAARLGPRAWDLAYALYRFSPLTDPTNPDGFVTSPRAQAERARRFLDAYGCSREERAGVVGTLDARLRALVTFLREAAVAGDRSFQRHIAEGHVDLYLRDLDHMARNTPTWQQVIVG
ncbi:aminoglycoside phosphotransferase family protein [Sorangium sp. So ce1036]|uniref:phosphotransferase n=1 Tax=Sorangium sp. So ce1036 TaxID=3133328 RepID=UPI003F0CF2A5